MFFSISKTPDHRFPFSDTFGDWIFNHDDGWTFHDNSWSKGYHYERISHGNFCQLEYKDNIIHLTHDRERSFPLWWNSQAKILTNCVGTGEKIWADRKVRLTKNDIDIETTDIIGKIDQPTIPYQTVYQQISNSLDEKFGLLKKETIPKKIFLSGGVDTLALFSYAKKHNIDCEILDYEYFIYDNFCNQFIDEIRNWHWAYKQMHHWKDNCLLITGSCGDEFMFRGPTTIAIWLAWHNINFITLLEKSQGYHVHYFKLLKNQKIFQYHYENRKALQSEYPEKEKLIAHLIDMNLNDHQHWHLGNTLTWTPFKDIEIFKSLLQVEIEELIPQFIDAKMSKELISPLYRGMLSEQKNHMSRQHLHQINIS